MKLRSIVTTLLFGSKGHFFLLVCFVCCFSCSEKFTKSAFKASELLTLEPIDSLYKVQVWLPDNYSKSISYSVLYMHDGQMLFDSTQTWNGQEWGVDETIQQLIDSSLIKSTIVVAIWNTDASRRDDYMPQDPFELLGAQTCDSIIKNSLKGDGRPCFEKGVRSNSYLNFIVNDLKPIIDQNFSVNSEASDTYICGSSMGGLISLYALTKYPDIFGGAASLSTHWPGIHTFENNPIPDTLVSWFADNIPDLKSHKLYFDYGTETLDRHYELYQLKMDSLLYLKYGDNPNYRSLKFEGAAHTENDWAERLNLPLTFLLKKD